MGKLWQGPLEKIDDYRWRIPKTYKQGMHVPGIIYANEKLMKDIRNDQALEQVANVAVLPGVVNYSLGMPDIHWGYGFPIGGVAATDIDEGGVISPGGVGYDINCGVRLVRSNLSFDEAKEKIEDLTTFLFQDVPAGVGSKGEIKVNEREEKQILIKGARWAVEKGFGSEGDLAHTEENGEMQGADPAFVSDRAFERGKAQSGTLGSGNHFMEIQMIDEIYDANVAERLNLFKGEIVLMIHSGSRGFGYQVCDDYINKLMPALNKYNINVPDRQLVCAPVNSVEGKSYLAAMKCAANYAWANRQCLMYLARKVFEKVFNKSYPALGMNLVYDVAHNIAKIEKHKVGGSEKTLCVHRKGATRAFGPGNPALPSDYKDIGQPVIIPGDMGRNSYLLTGTQKAMEETFGSTCFTGDTRILTKRGIVTLQEIYEMYKLGISCEVASINTNSLSLEWKPIIDSFKRQAEVIKICVSQTNRSKFGTLKVTPNHKFATFHKLELVFKEIESIFKNAEMICVLDRLDNSGADHNPSLAYLAGALFTDGYIRLSSRHGQVIFTQKKTLEKLEFIGHVVFCFQEVFDAELKEKCTKVGGGIIRGRYMRGETTDFSCAQKLPATALLKIYENLHTWVLSLDEESILNFLAGALDGDGTWNPDHHVLEIFNNDERLTGAIVLACLKLGILPYISIQRKNIFIIQISEKRDLLLQYTKRLKAQPRKRKYGSKFFSVRQLFLEDFSSGVLKWPYLQKAKRNNLMEAEKISKFLTNSNARINKDVLEKIISSCLRMQRVRKLDNLGIQDVYNINVGDNHNYIVYTDNFTPVVVKNCHGAGRLKSRHEAMKNYNASELVKELKNKGIIVMASTRGTISEEAPGAYKDVNDVVDVVDKVGIAKKVCRMRPLGVIKG